MLTPRSTIGFSRRAHVVKFAFWRAIKALEPADPLHAIVLRVYRNLAFQLSFLTLKPFGPFDQPQQATTSWWVFPKRVILDRGKAVMYFMAPPLFPAGPPEAVLEAQARRSIVRQLYGRSLAKGGEDARQAEELLDFQVKDLGLDSMVGEKRDVSEFFQVVDTGMGSFHSCMAEFMQGYSVGVATKVESLGQIISPVTSEEGKLMTNLLAKSAAAADAKRAKDEPSV